MAPATGGQFFDLRCSRLEEVLGHTCERLVGALLRSEYLSIQLSSISKWVSPPEAMRALLSEILLASQTAPADGQWPLFRDGPVPGALFRGRGNVLDAFASIESGSLPTSGSRGHGSRRARPSERSSPERRRGAALANGPIGGDERQVVHARRRDDKAVRRIGWKRVTEVLRLDRDVHSKGEHLEERR